MRSSSWNGNVTLAFCSGLSAASKRLAVSVITETVWTWLCIPLEVLGAWFWAWLCSELRFFAAAFCRCVAVAASGGSLRCLGLPGGSWLFDTLWLGRLLLAGGCE